MDEEESSDSTIQFFSLSKYDRLYEDLEPDKQDKVDDAIEQFVADPHHPSLNTEKIDKERNIWTFRASDSIRVSFNWEGDGVPQEWEESEVTLRVVGEHENVYENP